MKLSSICLQNFRCFEDTTINFHEQLTVLVGGNGSGKTAVLDGISAVLAQVCMRLAGVEISQKLLVKADEANNRNSENPYSLFLVIANVGKFVSKMARNKSGIMEGHLNVFDFNGKEKRSPNAGDFAALDAPVMYYNTYRHTDKNITTSRELVPTKQEALQSVYSNTLDVRTSIETTLGWFAGQEFEEAKQAKQKRNLDHVIPELQAVRDGVTLILGDYEKPYTDKTPAELFIYKKGEPTPYSLSQLSDGYRTMLALVMDLARRMAVVNGEAYTKIGKSVLESPAIVLIDEVELHLHPSWQQRVLPDLMRTFPNTQFIVTTHSPQVISSVKPENVRILKDGKVLRHDYSTYGAESSRVLNEVFGVETRSQHNAAKQALDKYFRLINDGLYNTPEAQSLREELETWLYEDPALLRANMLIERLKRRKAREGKNA